MREHWNRSGYRIPGLADFYVRCVSNLFDIQMERLRSGATASDARLISKMSQANYDVLHEMRRRKERRPDWSPSGERDDMIRQAAELIDREGGADR